MNTFVSGTYSFFPEEHAFSTGFSVLGSREGRAGGTDFSFVVVIFTLFVFPEGEGKGFSSGRGTFVRVFLLGSLVSLGSMDSSLWEV
jgi:hypothetical protein